MDFPQSVPQRLSPNEWKRRPRRYTICTTLNCNLACSYCYVSKRPAVMSPATAAQVVDFIFRHAPSSAPIEIGFFGGEPLLAFPLMRSVVDIVEHSPFFDPERVNFTVTTNGTLFSGAIATFFREHAFKVCISCDGAPHVQNYFRRTVAGKDTAALVERTIFAALESLPLVLVNAVYRPETLPYLPEAVEYFSRIGLRHIFINPDYSAHWTSSDAKDLTGIYSALADLYIDWYRNGDPHFVSIFDTKIAALLRGGYHPLERCQMGTGELTFTPDGGIYPCERLIGSGERYRIGSLDQGLDLSRLSSHCAPNGGHLNRECSECALKDYCMHWCSCSNVFMTGYYDRVGPFLCASERAAIQASMDIFARLEQELGPVFVQHLAGLPQWNAQVKHEHISQPLNPIETATTFGS